jgi:uncharacterized protein
MYLIELKCIILTLLNKFYHLKKQASFSGNKELAEFLLQKGACIHEKDIYGYTALFAACGKGHIELAELLINNGANINEKSFKGGSVLMLGIRFYKQNTNN